MSSAAYYGQRTGGYEAGASERETCRFSASTGRPWLSTRDAQDWSESYQGLSQPHAVQRQQYQPPSQSSTQSRHSTSNSYSASASRQSRPATPGSTRSGLMTAATSVSGDAQSMVLHSLQLPGLISPKGGNLADFAAQLTCLFWFESPKVLEAAETIKSVPSDMATPALSSHALPTEPFRKWVSSVLTTTQVTQNVILLALLFVYRLKMTNPSVRGRPGSEYRLLTVALMLGNKFLDDNTYTNKTWAEVSGISVQDIHVMEVEFLSNMRYALLASSEQWDEWLDKLSSYHVFCERVAKGPSPSLRPVPSPTFVVPSPTGGRGLSPIVSPTACQSAQHSFPPARGNRPYSSPSLPPNPLPMMYTEAATNVVSPLHQRPDFGVMSGRKRSWDEQLAEPPTKRSYRAPQTPVKTGPDARRLPVPALTLNTNYQTPINQGPYSGTGYSIPQSAPFPVSLPPIEPGTRAMSTVYAPPPPPTTVGWAPASTATAINSNMSHQAMCPASLITPTNQFPPTTQYPPTTTAAFGTSAKRLSPINTLTPASAYNGSSPLHEYPANSGFHTPITHSPSIYLQQRNSPYKPIRHVRTLLNPPPPLSLQSYQLPAIPPSQMHYQPIGRRNDQRTGIVPEYRMHDAYNRHGGMPVAQSSAGQPSHHRLNNLMD
ncbi:hypothetical protein BD289DRAFT_358537 [Coniella lustricola]|uniref:Cyclin-domain-containing protein n=1 Tax=Coniella lustricola TaxID=2025994 RepID=A0A2T3ANA4_9PEZI|nr:hypothetical protein BD289DRAFT_358537 [Coniella lustricola]